MVADAIAGVKNARNHLLDRLCGKAGPVREDIGGEEQSLLFIRRLMPAEPPPRSVPTVGEDGTGNAA